MSAFGVLIMCYVAVQPGQYEWVKGRDIGSNDEVVMFKAPGRKAEFVNGNNCKYLENPVQVYVKMLKQKNAWDREVAGAKKKMVDKRTVGNKPWCLVDEYGRRRCMYNSMSECLQRVDKLSYCEQKELGD